MLRKLSPCLIRAGICRKAHEAGAERGVHVVELIGSNPVVVGHGILRQINKQLLQRSILLGQRIGRRGIVAAVAVREEHHGIVLRGVVVLRRAVELIEGAGTKASGEAGERNRPLVLQQDDIGQRTADRLQVGVFLDRNARSFRRGPGDARDGAGCPDY